MTEEVVLMKYLGSDHHTTSMMCHPSHDVIRTFVQCIEGETSTKTNLTIIQLSEKPESQNDNLSESDVLDRVSRFMSAGPVRECSFVDFIVNRLIFVRREDKRQMSLVHIASRNNRLDILEWLQSACCDCALVTCTNTSCQLRRNQLWTAKDSFGLPPLFDAVRYGALYSCTYLCSQSIVSESLNMKRDNIGNLPISIAMNRRDFGMCDLLMLFGATLETTSGLSALGLGESLMHSAMRRCDIETISYIAKRAPKVLLKKNQKGETALFSCLRDKRSSYYERHFVNTTCYGAGVDGCNAKVPSYSLFFSEVLSKGPTWFGADIFKKALLYKNNFGRNIIMESVIANDFDSLILLCHHLLNNYGDASSNSQQPAGQGVNDSPNFLHQVMFDTDCNGKTVFHLALETNCKLTSLTDSNVHESFRLMIKLFNASRSSNTTLTSFLKSKTSRVKATLNSSSYRHLRKLEDESQ